jgi:hypothetical protein
MAVPHLDENPQPCAFFLLPFERLFPIILEGTNCCLRAVCQKDRWEVYVLTNIHVPSAKGNFRPCQSHESQPVSLTAISRVTLLPPEQYVSVGKLSHVYMQPRPEGHHASVFAAFFFNLHTPIFLKRV